MRNRLFRAVVLSVAAVLVVAAFGGRAGAQEKKSLYARLGGYDALAAVTDDFIGNLANDKLVARFLTGLSDDSKVKLREHVIEFLCDVTGGPCHYTGRDMKTAHKGLGITSADWDSSVKDLTMTLDKFKVPAQEKGEVLSAIGGLKKDIVEK